MAAQREYAVAQLPANGLDAHAKLLCDHLDAIRTLLDDPLIHTLTIVLPPASSDHDGWRRALAGDLAREYSPKRVNIAAGPKGNALDEVIGYLGDAPGVTGHYAQAHE